MIHALDHLTGSVLSLFPSKFAYPNLVLPKQQLVYGEDSKQRGSWHHCLPFGKPDPGDPRYAHLGEITENHGDLRDGTYEVAGYGPEENPNFTNLRSRVPWDHEVQTVVMHNSHDDSTNHMTTVKAHEAMPLSYGLHTYFPVLGEKWVVHINGAGFVNADPNYPILVPVKKRDEIVLTFGHHRVTITILEGYDNVVIWTDRPDMFVCVEPVFIGDGPFKGVDMEAGQSISFQCLFEYEPIPV